jgi:integrase
MITLEAAYELYLADANTRSTDSSITTMRRQLSKFMEWQHTGDKAVDEISAETLNDWKQFSEKNGAKGNGRILVRRRILLFYSWLVRNKHLAANPIVLENLVKIFPVQVQRPPFTYQQHLDLLKFFADNFKQWDYWHLACVLGWGTGLRVSDIACLRWDNCDFENQIIHLKPLKTARFEKTVTIPMDADVLSALQSQMTLAADGPHWQNVLVFPIMQNIYERSAPMLVGQFKLACERVGIPIRYSFHSYRHAFISRLMNANVNPKVIQSMTGQSLTILYGYVSISPDAQREALEKARPRLGDKI